MVLCHFEAPGVVVEAYRLDRYDNSFERNEHDLFDVVEAYRLDRYDNSVNTCSEHGYCVVEAYRLDRYDNILLYYLFCY